METLRRATRYARKDPVARKRTPSSRGFIPRDFPRNLSSGHPDSRGPGSNAGDPPEPNKHGSAKAGFGVFRKTSKIPRGSTVTLFVKKALGLRGPDAPMEFALL